MGRVLFYGKGGSYLIGPTDERWDAAMLVRQSSMASFLAFASDREYYWEWRIAPPRSKIPAYCRLCSSDA